MAVTGKLEVIIKIDTLPDYETLENHWKTFEIDCDGREMSVSVRPKIWNKLVDAQAKYPQWMATISGKLGAATQSGFVLEDVKIQVLERKSKEATAGSESVATTAKSLNQESRVPTLAKTSLDEAFKRKSQERMQRLNALKQKKKATTPELNAVLEKPSNFKTPAQLRQIAKMNIEVR
jgi:hypothetical protein